MAMTTRSRVVKRRALAAQLLVWTGGLACVAGLGGGSAELAGVSAGAASVSARFEPIASGLAPIDVRRVSVTPQTFVPGETSEVVLRFATGVTAPVRVEIVTEAGALVRAFELASVGPEGAEIRWNGEDAAGEAAPSGVYVYRIYTLDAERRVRGRYGDPPVGGGEEVLAQRFTFDRRTGNVEFILPEPARVRLRMGIESVPVLRTFYAWEPLEAGRHTIQWDGMDHTGKIRLRDHPKMRADLVARSLPQNALFLRRQPIETRDPCAELCFQLELLDPLDVTEDGRPVVGDQATFRVRVDDPAERERLINSRFEIMVFLDTIYLFEEEDGAVPFSYRLDTRALTPGTHLLTVNVLGYDQRIGIQTLELVKAAP